VSGWPWTCLGRQFLSLRLSTMESFLGIASALLGQVQGHHVTIIIIHRGADNNSPNASRIQDGWVEIQTLSLVWWVVFFPVTDTFYIFGQLCSVLASKNTGLLASLKKLIRTPVIHQTLYNHSNLKRGLWTILCWRCKPRPHWLARGRKGWAGVVLNMDAIKNGRCGWILY
jgi:hypothetical protein